MLAKIKKTIKAVFGPILIFLALFCLFISFPKSQIEVSKLLASISSQAIMEKINPARISYGRLELKMNEKLSRAAELKAQDMVSRNYFSHKDPLGQDPWIWLDRVGYDYISAGENLAIDVNDPSVLLDAWLSSPSHAKNILNSNFIDMGVGLAKGEVLGRKTIVVVMYFGSELKKSIKSQGQTLASITDVSPKETAVVCKADCQENEDINTNKEELYWQKPIEASRTEKIKFSFLIWILDLLPRY
jgi:uncharacterized protein YkwD